MYDEGPRKSLKQELKEREESLKYRKKLRALRKEEIEFAVEDYKQLGSDVKRGAERTGSAIKGFLKKIKKEVK